MYIQAHTYWSYGIQDDNTPSKSHRFSNKDSIASIETSLPVMVRGV